MLRCGQMRFMQKKIEQKEPVVVLGASGIVGQMCIALLENHPLFELRECVASEQRNGQSYAETVEWQLGGQLPSCAQQLRFIGRDEIQSKWVISCLPTDIARVWEKDLRQKGHHISSNASASRMDPDVPLIISEINPQQIELILSQKNPGKLVTNPNCAVVMLSFGLNALLAHREIENISVTTLQAVSGAGLPGVASFSILGNSIPHIGGEEIKICQEPLKIFQGLRNKDWSISAQVHRIPVLHGHTISAEVQVTKDFLADDWKALLREESGSETEALVYSGDAKFPQPRLHLRDFDGRVFIGQIKQGVSSRHIRFTTMGHNLTRGAALAALENLELMRNYLEVHAE